MVCLWCFVHPSMDSITRFGMVGNKSCSRDIWHPSREYLYCLFGVLWPLDTPNIEDLNYKVFNPACYSERHNGRWKDFSNDRLECESISPKSIMRERANLLSFFLFRNYRSRRSYFAQSMRAFRIYSRLIRFLTSQPTSQRPFRWFLASSAFGLNILLLRKWILMGYSIS